MIKFKALIIALSTILMIMLFNVRINAQNDAVQKDITYKPNWKSLAQHKTPKWYKDAVLGIYFHWGVYSVPAFGCWGGRNMYQPNGGRSEAWGHIKPKYKNTYDYVKKVYGTPGTEFGYKDFIPMFKAQKWNPDKWAKLFKEAGADFAGPVAVHHDGFAMWDSKFDKFNAKEMGPHRDVVGDILKAIRKQGLKTITTFHLYTNWFYYNPGRKICPPGVDVNDPKYAGLYGPVRKYKGNWRERPFSESFQQYWYNMVNEVIDNYHPDLLWFEIGFDNPGCIGKKYVKSVLANYFNSAENRGQQVVVTHKANDLPSSCSILDLEGSNLKKPRKNKWQTDTPLGTHFAWAYSPDAVSMPINAIVDAIVDRKSKNGVTLLDVAPKSDGTLPPSQIKSLKELGKWMSINKEALYASEPAPFVKGGTDNWKAGEIRFTKKGKYLYAIDLGNDSMDNDGSPNYPQSTPPSAPYIIPNVKPLKGSVIQMLGSSKDLKWHMKGQNLIIEELPEPLPCKYAWTFKIRYK